MSCRFRLSLSYLAALMLAFVPLGCDDDDEGNTGASCRNDGDCSDGRCIEGGDYPDGICTYYCSDNRDCPGGWICADKKGGICLELCGSSSYCHDLYDRDWECRSVDENRGNEKSRVCLGD